MPVQTHEAVTDDKGNVRLADTVRLPAYTKVYIAVPEQTTPYAAIVPEKMRSLLLDETDFRDTLQELNVSLFFFDVEQEVITEWIPTETLRP